eukprot:Gregarina_sp_Pseudo_9__1314@NODE_1879_length_1278_cov_25_577885_g524_i1_p5_GENE_NODE_1879_length_1278_cov_25_577885_g524_i1NODE_1879_length_1278_cov_25_577885_g524_i1_p5_ORF_typecomplete_len109_score10_80MMADHC/PF10229_9/0_057_NODE_1879_length_1278_cov_25_577885_g524_i19361262
MAEASVPIATLSCSARSRSLSHRCFQTWADDESGVAPVLEGRRLEGRRPEGRRPASLADSSRLPASMMDSECRRVAKKASDSKSFMATLFSQAPHFYTALLVTREQCN